MANSISVIYIEMSAILRVISMHFSHRSNKNPMPSEILVTKVSTCENVHCDLNISNFVEI